MEDEERTRIIEAKIQRYDEMEAENRRVKEVGGVENVISATEILQALKAKGMVKMEADGTYKTPSTPTQQVEFLEENFSAAKA